MEDAERQQIALLLNTVLWLTIVLSLVGSAAAAISAPSSIRGLGINVLIIAFEFAGLWVLRRGYIHTAAWLVVGSLWVGITLLTVFITGPDGATPALYAPIVVIGTLVLSPQASLLLNVATVGVVSIFYLLTILDIAPAPVEPNTDVSNWISYVTAITATGALLSVATRTLRKTLTGLRETTVSRDYFESILQSIQDMLLVVGPNLFIIRTNRAALQHLGYRVLEGRPLHDLLRADPQTLDRCRSALQTGAPFSTMTSYHGHDGSVIPITFSATPLPDGRGLVCVARDIGDRLRTESQLHQRAGQLTAMYDIMLQIMQRLEIDDLLAEIAHRAGSLVGTPHVVIDLVNEAETHLTSRLATGMMKHYARDVIPLGEGVAGRVYQSGETQIVTNYGAWEGRVPYYDEMPPLGAIAAAPLTTGHGSGIVVGVIAIAVPPGDPPFDANAIDVLNTFARLASVAMENAHLYTAMASELQERLAAEAALAERNDELEQFAYVASHDLQEPLRKIQAFGGRVRKRGEDVLDETALDYLVRMESAAARMQALIHDLLTFSRVTTKAQPFAEVDLNAVLAGVLNDLEVRIEATQAVVQPDDLPTIRAEPFQMRQLFQNLLSNALKYHREGVPPNITVGFELAEDGRTGTINVSDNGIGFDADHTEQIFGVFQRLHSRSAYPGTGIGLAICRKIVERHGGSITAHGVPGEGATFSITLPIQQEAQAT